MPKKNEKKQTIYQDIIKLVDDHERFTLDSLLELSIPQWLAGQNPVIVKFLETLMVNEQLEGEKLFKCAVALDAIYGARHLKYDSAINLATYAIKYSIARSKKIVDVDKHILSLGSFSKFINGKKV